MLRVATLLLAIVVASGAHGEDRLAVVLDLSVGSWNSLKDGTPAFVAARSVLDSWVLELPPDLPVELRTIGGANFFYDLSSCRDSRTEIPLGPVVDDAWHHALLRVRPTGLRPLLFGVGAAAGDLGTGDDLRRIIVLTSGEDDCNGNPDAVVEAVSGGVELRIIGLALSSDAAERFGAVAPTRNATSAESLLEALRWAVEDLTDESPADGEIRITTSSFAGLIAARLVHTITQQEIETELVGDVVSATLPPGTYALQAEGTFCGMVEVRGLRIQAGRKKDIHLTLEPQTVVSLEVAPEWPTAGAEIFLAATGAPPASGWISVATAGQPDGHWQYREAFEPGETGAWIKLPEEQGVMEIRFNETLEENLSRVIARTEVETLAASAALTAPTEIGTLEEIPVSWTGPDNPGDNLTISRIGSGPTRFAACVSTNHGSPVTLVAPADEGEWEIRYLTGQSGRDSGPRPDRRFRRPDRSLLSRIGLGGPSV